MESNDYDGSYSPSMGMSLGMIVMRLTQKGSALFFAEDLKCFAKNRKCEDIYAFLTVVSDLRNRTLHNEEF